MKKLIVIAGPTASGKTDLAIQIAQYFQTEIISADSRQCYKELKIGVAKPSDEQLNKVHHYFINSHSILDDVSVGLYEKYALDSLQEIFIKNDIAVCVGGTGLYIKALCEGIDTMPPIDEKIIDQIELNYSTKGIKWLQDEIKIKDELFFHEGEMSNPARMIRALSFMEGIGESILQFRKKEIKKRDFEIHSYAIEIERGILYQRINDRVDFMIKIGLEDEVRSLLNYQTLKSLNTVGYSELFKYFNHEFNLNEAIEKIKQHSRNYAKRQITWFKNQGNYKIISAEAIFKEIIDRHQ
ncbi:MAG TPA: tRNA (adenosine(37)-N6)-dimethylallyltransferase MiaA [Chitinophagaceae bacterium]|nr:tRNA (adenosine(37)-N6)-dimethylallyltransferase MiaA [Chitinophagaceae bacterium]